MIDAHCHLIPTIDDGAKSWSMALAMAQIAVTNGTDTIICTPHHLNGVFKNPRHAILTAVIELQEQLTDAGLALQLAPGSELHLVPELPSQLLEGEALSYADHGHAALVELPKQAVPLGTDTILEQLLYRNITPIIAHPERNTELVRHPERLAEWIEWGCKSQITAQSCSGDFGRPLQQLCRDWCAKGWVHIVASDAHRPRGRTPNLQPGYHTVSSWFNEASADLLFQQNPARLLTGEPLQSMPPIPQNNEKPWWCRWLA